MSHGATFKLKPHCTWVTFKLKVGSKLENLLVRFQVFRIVLIKDSDPSRCSLSVLLPSSSTNTLFYSPLATGQSFWEARLENDFIQSPCGSFTCASRPNKSVELQSQGMPTACGPRQGISRIARRERLYARFTRSSTEVIRVRIHLKYLLSFLVYKLLKASDGSLWCLDGHPPATSTKADTLEGWYKHFSFAGVRDPKFRRLVQCW